MTASGMKDKETKANGGMVIPREAIPPSRIYTDKYARVWNEVAKLTKANSYAIDPTHIPGGSVNSLRCGLRRAKQRGRVAQDVQVRFDGTKAYFVRGKKG